MKEGMGGFLSRITRVTYLLWMRRAALHFHKRCCIVPHEQAANYGEQCVGGEAENGERTPLEDKVPDSETAKYTSRQTRIAPH